MSISLLLSQAGKAGAGIMSISPVWFFRRAAIMSISCLWLSRPPRILSISISWLSARLVCNLNMGPHHQHQLLVAFQAARIMSISLLLLSVSASFEPKPEPLRKVWSVRQATRARITWLRFAGRAFPPMIHGASSAQNTGAHHEHQHLASSNTSVGSRLVYGPMHWPVS